MLLQNGVHVAYRLVSFYELITCRMNEHTWKSGILVNVSKLNKTWKGTSTLPPRCWSTSHVLTKQCCLATGKCPSLVCNIITRGLPYGGTHYMRWKLAQQRSSPNWKGRRETFPEPVRVQWTVICMDDSAKPVSSAGDYLLLSEMFCLYIIISAHLQHV